jgi:hypothetical protein
MFTLLPELVKNKDQKAQINATVLLKTGPAF